jgi:O-antigen/teichoic acid export membrane protein
VIKITNNKFNSDLIWNLICFAFVVVIGIMLNAIITKFYDESVLGVFNQIYAIYMLLSQLAVGGVHLSVQKYIPEYTNDSKKANVILTSALVLATLTSITVIVVAYILRGVPGSLLDSPNVTDGFPMVLGGLLFFSYNKILLSYHNAYRRMKTFGFFSALRFFFTLCFLLGLIHWKANPNYLACSLALAETALFLCVSFYSLHFFKFSFSDDYNVWMKKNFQFGNKALLGNFLMDVNTRVDVFLIGIFLNDASVGIYSLGATIAEGVAQLPILLRNNINPIISKCYTTRKEPVFKRLLSRNIKSFYKILSPLAIASILGFPLYLWIFSIHNNFYTIWGVYATLTLGLAASAGYLPFQMLFNQVGKPSIQTLFIVALSGTNVLLNILLIPLFGVIGAGIATGLSLVAQIFIQKYLTKRVLGFSI